jgi:tripartite-type tricarboxylate transporter receptor subunit TctC
MSKLASRSAILLIVLEMLASRTAFAQADFPTRTITMVVAFEAGGSSDIVARLLAQKLGKYTGVSVIVENVPGAATIVGTEKVARSRPDGYTLYLASSTPFATNPNFYKTLEYSIDDFEPITTVTRLPLILDMNPSFPGSSVKDFVAYAKTKPNDVTIATPGRGSVGEIVNGMTRGLLGIPVTNVPYRGGTPAVTDVMAPACVISGNDVIHTPETARKFARLVPNSELHEDIVLKRADNNLLAEWDRNEWREAEPRFATIFSEFLQRAESRA